MGKEWCLTLEETPRIAWCYSHVHLHHQDPSFRAGTGSGFAPENKPLVQTLRGTHDLGGRRRIYLQPQPSLIEAEPESRSLSLSQAPRMDGAAPSFKARLCPTRGWTPGLAQTAR